MNTQSRPSCEGLPLPALLEESERVMIRAGYKESTTGAYLEQWHRLAAFAQEKMQPGVLSNELIEAWLSASGYPIGCWPSPKPGNLVCMLAAVRILALVHESGDLTNRIPSPAFGFAYQEGICCYRALRSPEGCYSSSRQRVEGLPASFRTAFARYEQDCHARGCRPSTLKNVLLHLPRFFQFLAERGIVSVDQITAQHISDYVVSLRAYAPATVAHYLCHARCILRFLHQRGLASVDLSSAVPPRPIRNYRNIPTVWTSEEITRLLAEVDRSSPKGKRDYAILLLAARLGMRVGDIIRLALDDLKWEQKRIEIVQSKTGQPLVLPLIDEVGWAIIDYLKHARPVSPHRQVFLSMQSPFAPFVDFDNLHHVITHYRRKAGIQRFKHQPVGMHTLRHSLATHLLANDTALHTISDVLGHSSTESTEAYTKVDLPQLRRCAIDPEEVTHAAE